MTTSGAIASRDKKLAIECKTASTHIVLKEPRQIHNLGKFVEDTKTDIDKGAEEVNKMEKKREEREHKIDEFIVSDSVLDIVKNNGMMVVRQEATNSY